jgi:murein DD-endopeptidase MepM/ murein hydrolase activator NlpD
MKIWPVPEGEPSFGNEARSSGAFWENRGDRRHCGVDISAPEGSRVLAVDDGEVLDVGTFTSSDRVPYWNTTYYVLVRHAAAPIGKYAELGEPCVSRGDRVRAGDVIGLVGSVLDPKRVSEDAPKYIQALIRENHHSMLHFECYRHVPTEPLSCYLGGNVFSHEMPDHLVDPTPFLNAISRG